MKTMMKYGLYGFLIMLIVVGAYFSATSFSILSEGETNTFDGMTCSESNECYQKLIDAGFPQSDLDAQLEGAELTCKNSVCGVKAK